MRVLRFGAPLVPFAACLLACCAGAPDDVADPRGGRFPERIAVMAPAAAEMLDALGIGDRVVGVGENGPWPATMSGLPRIGGYAAPSVERILALECDLFLTTESVAGSPAHGHLESLGVRVLALDTSTFDGVFHALTEIGAAFGRDAEAAALARSLRDQLDAIAQQVADRERPLVLFVVGRDPVFVAGPGSHIDEMIAIAGGRNLAADAQAPYQQFSLEVLLERAPQVIIDTSDNRPGAPRGRALGSWGQWPFLPAVEHDRVYQIDPGRLVIPGIRLPEMTRLVGRLIHPEVFGEPTTAELGPATARGGS